MNTQDNSMKTNLAALCREAETMGASRALFIPAAEIVVDKRTPLKCMVPLCAHYGTDLMCPPNVISPAAFADALSQYRQGMLVKVDMPSADIAEGAAPPPKFLEVAREARLKLHVIVSKVESMSLAMGYYYAAGFIGGSCPLCESCVGTKSGLPCRHPFKARPAMEGVGIDVMATAGKVGLKLGFGKGESRSWVGLVLIA